MALRLGIDFGTATSSVAVVSDAGTLATDVLRWSDGSPLLQSRVWSDAPRGRQPIIPRVGPGGRAPLSVSQEADIDFHTYWHQRVESRRTRETWEGWLGGGRESALLLNNFKPELADGTRQEFHSIYSVRSSSRVLPWTGTSEFDFAGGIVQHSFVSPLAATDDLVAGAAAILRCCAARVRERYGERIEALAIGVPSLARGAEREAGESRRNEAIDLAALREDFGTSGMVVKYYSESFAAASSLDIEASAEPFVIVIDVGAGTTDMSLVSYSRSVGGRWVADSELVHDSARFAGRDVNGAILGALCCESGLREAVRFMDWRARQYLLDYYVEDVKLRLGSEPQAFQIPVGLVASMWEGSSDERRASALLRRWCFPVIGLDDTVWHVRCAARSFQKRLRDFLQRAQSELGRNALRRVAAIELVGGGVRFPPLREVIEATLKDSPLGSTKVQFRDTDSAAQTAVVRGLARRIFLDR